MSEEYETDTENGKKKRKIADEVIELRHTYEKPEDNKSSDSDLAEKLEREKKRREELELIVEAEAYKSFEDEKNAFLNLVPDEKKRKELEEKIADDPTRLREYQDMTGFLATMLKKSGVNVTGLPDDFDDDETSKVPTGRAKMLRENQSGIANSYKAYVDELYDILKDPSKTKKEKQIADRQINQLFVEMTRGIKARKDQSMPFLPPTASCDNCGAQLIGDLDNCQYCGWSRYSKNFTPRR